MQDDRFDVRIRQLTEAARAYKRATGRTVSTDELGELYACKLLGLTPAGTNNAGYDGTDAQGNRVQVKSRAPRTAARVNERGRIGRFTNWNFDYALLVLFDGELTPEDIWRAERDDLRPLQDAIANPAHGLHVNTFMHAGRLVWERIPQGTTRRMKLRSVMGLPDVDSALATFPEAFAAIAPYDQRVGYKSSQVKRRGRRVNWLQWNDGHPAIRIAFPNRQGEARKWKLFARFPDDFQPRGPWERPERYDRQKDQYMPTGPDVWGCSYEVLRDDLPRLHDLEEALINDLGLSYRYAVRRYGES